MLSFREGDEERKARLSLGNGLSELFRDFNSYDVRVYDPACQEVTLRQRKSESEEGRIWENYDGVGECLSRHQSVEFRLYDGSLALTIEADPEEDPSYPDYIDIRIREGTQNYAFTYNFLDDDDNDEMSVEDIMKAADVVWLCLRREKEHAAKMHLVPRPTMPVDDPTG